MFLDLDTWMVRLFGAEQRPATHVIEWYLERRERCRNVLWDVALDVLRCGIDVFLEFGLVTVAEREAFYARACAEEICLAVYLIDAPRDVRRERVSNRNRSADPYCQVVPLEFFERASDAWQPLSAAERARWSIIDV